MTKDEIYTVLNEVFREVFDDDTIVVGPSTTANDIEDWDSLEHITLVAAIESRFQVKFKVGEVVRFRNVGEMADILYERLQA